jgi:taurine--2-oxoglutarate transaminase
MEKEDVIGNTQRMGKVMSELHQEMKQKHRSVGDIRSIGLFGALELVKDRKTKEPMPADVILKLGAYLKQQRVFSSASCSLPPALFFFLT